MRSDYSAAFAGNTCRITSSHSSGSVRDCVESGVRRDSSFDTASAQPINRVYPKPVVAVVQTEGGCDASFSARELFPGMSFLLVNHVGRGSYTIERSCGVYYCHQGTCDFHSAKGLVALKAGSVSFVAPEMGPVTFEFPEKPFSALALLVDLKRIPQDLRIILRTCFGVGIDGLMASLPDGGLDRALRENPAVMHVISELYVMAPEANRAYLRCKAFELLTLLAHQGKMTADQVDGAETLRTVDRHMVIAYRAYNEMTRDLTCQITIPQLAEACNTSPTLLKEAFKESFGMPIYTWFRAYRIQKACELLDADRTRSIASVATEVGYSNPSKFAKAFSDCTGMTPRAWRLR